MSSKATNHVGTLLSTALLCLVALALVAAPAGAQRAQFLSDGAIQNNGGWDLPAPGSCPADTSKTTRPDCLSLRFTEYTTSADCTAAATGGANRSWSTGACNDLQATTLEACNGKPGRFWMNGVCAVTMKGYDRNNVQCTLLGGTWVTTGTCTGAWVIVRTDYNPQALTSGTGTGDLCLRCHRSDTEWNGPRVRDVEGFLQTGHKNVVKPVKPGQSQSPLHSTVPYPSDEAGNVITWGTGATGATITTATGTHDLYFLVNNWMAPLGRSFYNGTGTPGYGSCSRCHTTNWKPEAAGVNVAKEPYLSFPNIASTSIGLNVTLQGTAYPATSWDLWGVGCTRCHGSAVNAPVDGVVAGSTYTAPSGMATHQNSMTLFDRTGACTDVRFNNEAACNKTDAQVLADYGMSPIAPGFVRQWITFSGTGSCSVAGVCSVDGVPDPTKDQAACTGAGTTWAGATDVFRCEAIKHYGETHGIPAWATARYTGTYSQRGQILTALCLNCHRSDDGGTPRESLVAGNSHGTLGMVGHAVGQAYLNSPHAQFTGTFAQVASGTYRADGTGTYKSAFMDMAEAKNTGNGCTGCHDVHKSILEHGEGGEHGGGPIRESCTDCHRKTADTLNHPMPEGTPLAELEEACIACHMPEPLLHLWRINPDPTYRTFPVSAVDGNVAANTAPDGSYTQAVWNDVDLACGSCHGGGARQATTTIVSTDSTGAYLTLNSVTGFDKAAKIMIPGAGALQNDGVTRAPYYGTIRTINPAGYPANTIRLLGTPNLVSGLPGRQVTQNYTQNGAFYATRALLAQRAVGMHAPERVNPFFSFTTSGLTVNFDATSATCAGAVCDEYEWEFGDGKTGIGPSPVYTYAAPGTYAVKLTVKYGIQQQSLTKTVIVQGAKPTASGVCTFDPATWTANVTYTGTTTNIRQVTVNWGDGTTLGVDKTAPYGPFAHTYLVPGSYAIRLRVVDKLGQASGAVLTCDNPVTVGYFTLTGTVVASGGAGVPNAKVLLLKPDGKSAGVAYTAVGTGAFSIGFLKPGSYTAVVTKPGYVFPVTAVTVPTAGVLITASP